MTAKDPRDADLEIAADGVRASDWLRLAAAPTFAIMALLVGIPGGGQLNSLCFAMPEASLLHGMAPMYLLMSAFHSAPWLKLIAKRRGAAHRCWSDVR